MADDWTYADKLISITGDSITFQNYYFPSGSPKIVMLRDVAWVDVKPPTLMNGKWRIHGTGTFKTWYPEDSARPTRDRIFFVSLKTQWVNIGFTVEDGERVEAIFKAKGFMKGLAP